MTIRLLVSPIAPDAATIARAATCLRDGGLVAFPTETVYGLGAHACDAAAVRKIFEAKGRPASDPLIVHVAALAQLATVAETWPPVVDVLAARFWPGPLTLVLPKRAGIPPEVTAGGPTVAVRIPAHPVAQALLRAAGVPVAAPSANLFSRPSPTRAAHVLHDLDGRIDMVLDGGEASVGVESTVLDLTSTPPQVLRPGAVTLEMLRAILPDVVHAEPQTRHAPLASPGLLDKHYSPRAPLSLYQGPALYRHATMLADTARLVSRGHRVAILAPATELPAFRAAGATHLVALGEDQSLEAMAASLYAALRDADRPEIDEILAAGIEASGGLADALRDRLRRAAAGRLITCDG